MRTIEEIKEDIVGAVKGKFGFSCHESLELGRLANELIEAEKRPILTDVMIAGMLNKHWNTCYPTEQAKHDYSITFAVIRELWERYT